MGQRGGDRWSLDEEYGIIWDAGTDTSLPHEDHLEMSGKLVSVIVRYAVDRARRLTLEKECVWPTLRLDPGDVRGYLRRSLTATEEPSFLVDGAPWAPGPVQRIRFDGVLTVEYAAAEGISAARCVQPSLGRAQVYDEWSLRGMDGRDLAVAVAGGEGHEVVDGMYGPYRVTWATLSPGDVAGLTGHGVSVSQVCQAVRVGQDTQLRPSPLRSGDRDALIERTRRDLVLETPDRVLNRAFQLAKLRAAESVFSTKRGLMHSPGGGRYYAGVWANDQAEYAGPFFPFLGEPTSVEASLNCYRLFAGYMKPGGGNIPSSLEMEGDIPFHAGGDRGDAAMVAYGASRFAMALGSRAVARELWPAIEWCLEYCRSKTNAQGVVESDTDELEGRFPTGKANLSTSVLTYGGLRSAAALARDLQHTSAARDYERRADELAGSIERYFGAEVEGFATYRYYDGNTTLRAWICLPLAVGLLQRRAGTVEALFSSRLWTPDGLATEAGDKVFWDRSTLYALRGLLVAGETERALAHLRGYTRRRLLGDHVPYPVEAWPEGGQAHLSAESALYCRVFTEGLFGITPVALRAFACTPRVPESWPGMSLRRVRAFGQGRDGFDLNVIRADRDIRVTVTSDAGDLYSAVAPEGATHVVELPDGVVA